MFAWFKSNLFNIISVLAFVMSASTWVYSWVHQRRNVTFRVVHYYPISTRHFFYMSIENKSRLPVLITQIYLVNDNGEKLECRVIPKKVYEVIRRVGGIEKDRELTKNMPLPIQLPSLGGVSGYVSFEDYQEKFPTLSTVATFQVHTNRGKSFQLTLPLGQILNSNQMLGL